MALELNEQLIQELQSHYGVGPQYAKAYLDSLQRSCSQVFKTLQDILNLPPPAPMWFDYALSTNYRGQQLYQLMTPYLPQKVQRYLDIGSGFGGFSLRSDSRGWRFAGLKLIPNGSSLRKSIAKIFKSLQIYFHFPFLKTISRINWGLSISSPAWM